MPTATPSPAATAPIMTAGDLLTFGEYQGEAIRWRVLAAEDGRALVVSERVIERKPFGNASDVTWEASTLRAWLNDDFYSAAFSDAERACIVETAITEKENAAYDIAGGPETRDNVFLLSLDEAEKYFASADDRRAWGSAYFQKQYQADQAHPPSRAWFLRSVSSNGTDVLRVSMFGDIDPFDISKQDFESNLTVYVRPALWIDMESLAQAMEQEQGLSVSAPESGPLEGLYDTVTITSTGKVNLRDTGWSTQRETAIVGEAQPGDTFLYYGTFGDTYGIQMPNGQAATVAVGLAELNLRGAEQPALTTALDPAAPAETPTQGSTSTPAPTATPTAGPSPAAAAPIVTAGDLLTFGDYQGEAIRWRVLAAEDGRALVVSERIIERKSFNTAPDMTWEISTMRAWLNDEFYGAAFSDAEQACIVETTITEKENPAQDIMGAPETQDNVFLLSLEEVEQYFASADDRRAWGSAYFQKRYRADQAYPASEPWFLRSVRSNGMDVLRIMESGNVDTFRVNKQQFEANLGTYVRPALWIDLESIAREPALMAKLAVSAPEAGPLEGLYDTVTITSSETVNLRDIGTNTHGDPSPVVGKAQPGDIFLYIGAYGGKYLIEMPDGKRATVAVGLAELNPRVPERPDAARSLTPEPTTTPTVAPSMAPTEAPTMAPTSLPSLSEATVGDILTIGSYQGDPIEWQVLETRNGRMLVISKYMLDMTSFSNDGKTPVTWAESSARAWLNGELLETAFTADERARIETTTVTNDEAYLVIGVRCEDTQDQLFLLSLAEAQLYFTDDESLIAWPSDYMKRQGMLTTAWASEERQGTADDPGWWWLRSPTYVGDNGHISSLDNTSRWPNIILIRDHGIRPAMWITTQSSGAAENVGQPARITGSTVNVRRLPVDNLGQSVGKVEKGEAVVLLDTVVNANGSYAEIQTNAGVTGYVPSQYVEIVSTRREVGL